MIRQSTITNIGLLRVGGGFIAVFSLAMSLLVLFVIPVACSFVGSLQLAILGLLFVLGAITFLVGFFLSRRKRKAGAEPGDAHK